MSPRGIVGTVLSTVGSGGVLRLDDGPPVNGVRPSVDVASQPPVCSEAR